MLKLVFINRYCYPDHSATSQMLTDLAFALAEQADFDVHVVTSRQRYEDADAGLPGLERVRGLTIHRVWTSRFGRKQLLGRAVDYVSFYVTALACLLRLANAQTVIVAKTDPPLISVVAAVAARLKSASLVNWIQDLFPEVASALGLSVAKGPIFAVLRALRNASLRNARLNVAIGERMKRRLQDEGVATELITVVHNWADGSAIVPVGGEENRLRRDWGLEDKFVVAYSGNLGRSHEFGTILDAAERLKGHSEIVFLVIGGGANLEWVCGETARRGLENFRFKPYQERANLAMSLSAADVHLISLKPELEGLIVPSKYYGIAAAGRPVIFIGAADGEIATLIRQSQCGFSVRQGDVDSLEREIRDLSANRERCRAMGQAARRSFDAGFSFEAARERWRSAILRVVQANSRA